MILARRLLVQNNRKLLQNTYKFRPNSNQAILLTRITPGLNKANFLLSQQKRYYSTNEMQKDCKNKELDPYGRPYPPKAGKYRMPSLTVDALCSRPNPQAPKNPKILMITRGHSPFKGSLAFPGGFVDYNENPETAVLRELKEEADVAGLKPELVGVFGDPQRDPRKHVVTIAYSVTLPEDAQVKAGDDASDAQWYDLSHLVELGEAEKLAFDHYQILKAYIKRYYADSDLI